MKEFRKINPEWLINIKRTGKLPDEITFQQVLENSLFYPAAGDDWRYIYCFTKLDLISMRNLLDTTSLLRLYRDRDIEDFYDYENFRHLHYYRNYLSESNVNFNSLRIDTFVYNDYRFRKKSPYNFDVDALLNTLSSKFKLLAEKYIDSYKIDVDISRKTAIYITLNRERINDICRLYVQDSKKFEEMVLKFYEEESERCSKMEPILLKDEPTFLHWSVWEDKETKKIFNLLYFSEEAHVNLLRTYVKNKKTPSVIISHRNGFGSHGCGWIDFLSYESPFIPMLMLNGLPNVFIYQHINTQVSNYGPLLHQLYRPIKEMDFSEIVPENFINVHNKPNYYNRDHILISYLFLEKLRAHFLLELFIKSSKYSLL